MNENIKSIKVSVIIPIFNVEKYLRECLDSVINQTLKDIEIICVDDGSTDNSLNILNEYAKKDNRIKVITQQNQHTGAARNNGLKEANGEFLSFLDSDDIFELNMLEEMYSTAIKDNSDTVLCSYSIYNEVTRKSSWNTKINKKFIDLSPIPTLNIKNEIFNITTPTAWTKLFKHSIFKDNNLEFINTICCNDITCVFLALALSKKISIINKPFVHYRYIQKSNLSSKRNKNSECFLIAAQKIEDGLKKFNLYDTFKESFESKITDCFNWESSLCDVKQNKERREIAKKILSNNLYNILYIKNKSIHRYIH